jgi:hypothetical protein
LTPVPSSTRLLPTMHQSANRAMTVGNDRDSKVLGKTSSLRSLLVNGKKVVSNRCLRSGANGGFLPFSENNQDGMRASFFELDDFNDLASRNEVDTSVMIPPPPIWAQSEFHESEESLFDIGNSDTDDENCSGSDLRPLLG